MDRFFDGLVLVVVEDWIVGAGELGPVVDGLAGHEDVAEYTGCAVEFGGTVGGEIRLEFAGRVEVEERCERGIGETGEVSREEVVGVIRRSDGERCKRRDVVFAPADHSRDVSKLVLEEQRGRCIREKITVDYWKPTVANVGGRVG